MLLALHQLAPERSQPQSRRAQVGPLAAVVVIVVVAAEVVEVIALVVVVVLGVVVALVVEVVVLGVVDVVVLGSSPGHKHGGFEHVQGAWMPVHLLAALPLQ